LLPEIVGDWAEWIEGADSYRPEYSFPASGVDAFPAVIDKVADGFVA
jgi:hypothetical protein